MPIYEFSCGDCDRSFEELVSSADAVKEVACPTCGSHRVRRKISLFAASVNPGRATTGGSTAASCAPGGA